jgi:hypothetical protein
MGADGRWPASGGAVCGSGELKREATRSFSLHVEASAGERAAWKAATVEISAGGRKSRSAAASSAGGARDPVNSNRYTCMLPMRRRSEGERLGSFTDDEGA